MKQKINFFIKKNQSGFTLIEILVVIAIVGILAGVIMVGFSSVRDNSEEKSLMKTMVSVNRSAKVCINENDGSVTNDVNFVSAGNPICVSGSSDNYPFLSPKITVKYDYDYYSGYGTEGSFCGFTIGTVVSSVSDCLVVCDVESGNCYSL